jgi:hypothetical protein
MLTIVKLSSPGFTGFEQSAQDDPTAIEKANIVMERLYAGVRACTERAAADASPHKEATLWSR